MDTKVFEFFVNEHIGIRGKFNAIAYLDILKLFVDDTGRTILRAAIEHNCIDIVKFVITKVREEANGYVIMKEYIKKSIDDATGEKGPEAKKLLREFINENDSK